MADLDLTGEVDIQEGTPMTRTAERRATLAVLEQVAAALHNLLEPYCEVLIHDFADYERSIICMEGNITGRSVGGAATDLLLAKASNGETDEDLFNYLTSLPGGRRMKSSTVFLRDESGHAYGAFCVNFDITAFLTMREQLTRFLATKADDEIVETFSDDIEETIHTLIEDTLFEMGQAHPLMGREEKVDLIARLADKGIFQVKKAVPIIADQLGLSRATVYNYLREAKRDASAE
jgi:predicted transcriptional regulator YheO